MSLIQPTSNRKRNHALREFGIVVSVAVILTGCGTSLSDLQSYSPADRATLVCKRSSLWVDAKKKYDNANKQQRLWQTDVDNGYDKKKECQMVQEPYSDSESQCYHDITGHQHCNYVTVTKYRSKKKCTNVYVPINVEEYQRTADNWKQRKIKYSSEMNTAWNECYSWAIRASPETLHRWLNN